VAWTETQSASFTVRHDSADADAAMETLDRLEEFRAEVETLFEHTPGDVSVILHPRPWALSLAHPWLPLARLFAAPASRRYMAGWFSRSEIHVLAPEALEERASTVPGSREALMLSPLHEYAHLVVGANNGALPPPFTPASFTRYLRWAWLCEGAATWLSGQARHLRPAIARRLREGPRPEFPPNARDAPLLGGTVFALLEQGAGPAACAELASSPLRGDRSAAAVEQAFARPRPEVERDWRDYLSAATAA
jgi:hypothetical protein